MRRTLEIVNAPHGEEDLDMNSGGTFRFDAVDARSSIYVVSFVRKEMGRRTPLLGS